MKPIHDILIASTETQCELIVLEFHLAQFCLKHSSI